MALSSHDPNLALLALGGGEDWPSGKSGDFPNQSVFQSPGPFFSPGSRPGGGCV